MIINGFIVFIKFINFYQITYFDATLLVYNHQNKITDTSHKNS